ncbi:MAG: hydroxyisourate hydrolase [Myxococcales bacterium]|nr:hydroxyisourate hydrolase [Myxococcales bacterium]
MANLSTHILDTTLGLPAPNVEVTLEKADGDNWLALGSHQTNDDGRVPAFLPEGQNLEACNYRLTFATGSYFEKQEVEHFYPSVSITFTILDVERHHHVPLLLNPFGYSTYRGS